MSKKIDEIKKRSLVAGGMPEAARKLEAATRIEAMAVILRGTANRNWGWFSREDERLHLQTVDKDAMRGPKKAKVWLENKGRRIFEIAAPGDLTSKEWKKLETAVSGKRDLIESRWTAFMVEHHWLAATIEESAVTLTAYPGTHNRFTRTIDLVAIFPGAYPRGKRPPSKVDLESSPGLLAVGPQDDPDERNHLALHEFLFVD